MVSGLMASQGSELKAKAEAAVWLSRLQGAGVTAATREGFQAWLRDSEANQVAFEHATMVWDIVPGAANETLLDEPQRSRVPRVRQWAAIFAAMLFVVVVGGYHYLVSPQPIVYATSPGQQQIMILSDGSRLSLNTRSRVEVDFDSNERRVTLSYGEAMFEVAKDPRHPFIVTSGDNHVRALGTAFVVRQDRRAMSATLLEGRVSVSRGAADSLVELAELKHGQRITIAGRDKVLIDYPLLEAITAWRDGQVMFDGATLEEALTELNRYGRVHLIVNDPGIASLRISGVFSTRDSSQFAETVAALYHLDLVRQGNRIRFEAQPSRPKLSKDTVRIS